jgi:hypothetical protein
MTHLAIIGAGVAGLVAARLLRQRRHDLTITIYEKSRGLGGRAATRRRDDYIFDHGAQYFKTPTPDLERLVTHELPTEGLHDIGLPIWTFDQAGVIAEGDPQQNAEPKWIYRDGLNRLGKMLAEGLDVQREVRIAALRRRTTDDGRTTDDITRTTQDIRRKRQNVRRATHHAPHWVIVDNTGQIVGEADLVLLTPPAPQSAAILAASDIDADVRQTLIDELNKARYRRCISLALAYTTRIERPFYALVNTDRAHPISWLALEHMKAPERCPPEHSLLIAQMAAQWSLDHWETPVEALQTLGSVLVSELLNENSQQPLWCDAQRWRYALPDSGADFETLNATDSGLFFAGDYTAGLGRVHLAIESGRRVGELIMRRLEIGH